MNSESFVNYILAKEKTPSPGTRLLKEVRISPQALHGGGEGEFTFYIILVMPLTLIYKKSLIVYDKYFKLGFHLVNTIITYLGLNSCYLGET